MPVIWRNFFYYLLGGAWKIELMLELQDTIFLPNLSSELKAPCAEQTLKKKNQYTGSMRRNKSSQKSPRSQRRLYDPLI